MVTDNALDVQAVLDRFETSRTTLDQLGEKLRGLTLAEEGADRATGSLSEAAKSVQTVADALAALLEQTATAQASLQEAVRQAAEFIGSTDLAAVTSSIRGVEKRVLDATKKLERGQQSVQEEIVGSIGFVQEQLTAHEEQLKQLDTRVGHVAATLVKSKDEEIATLRATLERVKETVPARHLAKVGL